MRHCESLAGGFGDGGCVHDIPAPGAEQRTGTGRRGPLCAGSTRRPAARSLGQLVPRRTPVKTREPMTQGITLLLPRDAASSDVDDLRRTLTTVEGVTDVRRLEVRAIDPGAVMAWISFTADALSIASLAASAIG